MQLTANVHVETGYRGANVGYVTTSRGIVMIESPQKPTDAIDWRKQIEEKGQVVYLINTEGHGDHVTGDYFFEVPVICHEKSRDSMLAMDINQLKNMIAKIDPEGVPLVSDYKINTPAIIFSERLSLYLGDHTFNLVNTPGHTVGQTSVFIPEERVVFTGDNVNYKTPAALHEAVPYKWLESLKKIKEMEVDHIVCGHGEVCDRSYLDEWAGFIREWIDVVHQAIKQGWSKEEAIEKISPPSWYAMEPDWADMEKMMLRRSINNLYDRLSEE